MPFVKKNTDLTSVPEESIVSTNFISIDLAKIHMVSKSQNFHVVHLEKLLQLCILVEVDNKMYICEEINIYA